MADPARATGNTWAEALVDFDLASVRASLDEARHNGWREADQFAAEMEQYLQAVRASRDASRLARLLAVEVRSTVTA